LESATVRSKESPSRKRLSDEQLAKKLAFKVIGPWGSSSLLEMVRDSCGGSGITTNGNGPVMLYSSSATASDEMFGLSLKEVCQEQPDDQDWVSRILEKKGNVIVGDRIPSDFQVLDTLLTELVSRGLTIGKDNIALISEWDTFYGRSLPLEFTAANCMAATRMEVPSLKGKKLERSCESHGRALKYLSEVDNIRQIHWIRRYSYLRGVDGEMATAAKPINHREKTPGTDGGRSKPGKTLVRQDPEALERPVGESQFDYIRRLAARIEGDANKLREEGDGEELKAIGILGSDVYDKLLILQALRKTFPRAIFFTTDLDARLLYSADYKWTRNLVLGSSFGLELHEDIQRIAPPFRDSYQTSTFFSILRAINHIRQVGNDEGPCLGQTEHEKSKLLIVDGSDICFVSTLTPRIYEAGRNGAVDLSIVQELPKPNGKGEVAEIHPLPRSYLPWWDLRRVALAAVATLAACVLLYEFGSFLAWGTLGCAVAVMGILAVIRFLAADPAGEPFFWLEGVSIWPTEMLRLLAAGLSIGFLWLASRKLSKNEEWITDKFALHPTAETNKTLGPSLMRRWLIEYAQPPSNVVALWQEYRVLEKARWSRVVPKVIVFIILAVGLFNLLVLPNRPCRGAGSCKVDFIVLWISVITLIVLILYVFDATRLFEGFIKRFTEQDTNWPNLPRMIDHSQFRGKDAVSDWLDIRLLAVRTKEVQKLIYYPFIVLAIIILSRMTVFDNWDFPTALLVVWGISGGYAVASAVLLSAAAEEARRMAIARLADKSRQARKEGRSEDAEELNRTIEEVKEDREGAFAPWTQHPVLRAILYPSGGLGLITSLQYLFL
jgi:hypothetical protein